MVDVCIIGAGWYGCHIALALRKEGYAVTIFEKNRRIFSENSGKFGVRLHTGSHYPRSKVTRDSCHRDFIEFRATYPQVLNEHEYSHYALGKLDEDDQPSKVDEKLFREVCQEFGNAHEVSPDEYGYQNVITAFNLDEPTVAVGRLQSTFEGLLKKAGVNLICNFTIETIQKLGNIFITIDKDKTQYQFKHVINATNFQAFLPPKEDPLPLSMEVVYQPCLALGYEDQKNPPPQKPFSFIVMDGLFPCIKPYDDREVPDKTPSRKYILMHAKWYILGTYPTAQQAQAALSSVDEHFIRVQVKPRFEAAIGKFWPEFASRFCYDGSWKGSVLGKIKSEREFRSAVTFQYQPTGMIYVISGKVSNIFDAAREVIALLKHKNVLQTGAYAYAKKGILHNAAQEVCEKPKDSRNSCFLQPYSSQLNKKINVKLPRELSNSFVEKPKRSKNSYANQLSVIKEIDTKWLRELSNNFSPRHVLRTGLLFFRSPVPSYDKKKLHKKLPALGGPLWMMTK